MHARAIETRYKGYRFRSRLEARWAVFFDALGLKWDYEPEGFELGNFHRYLPDFRVTGVDTNPDPFTFWFEVKPSGVLAPDDLRKLQLFAAQQPHPLILLDGVPEVRSYKSISPTGADRLDDWLVWSTRKRPWWIVEGVFPGPCDGEVIEWALSFYHRGGSTTPLHDWQRAVEAARGARFEHGESGARR